MHRPAFANWLLTLVARPMIRWWIVGLAFSLVNLPVLYALREFVNLPLAAATLISGEIGTLLRFFFNDRWVFGNSSANWQRLWKYHVAVASSFAIWWVVTNALAAWGVNYLLATLLGTACSVGWSMVTNFRWIWRPGRVPVAPSVPVGLAAED